MEVLAGTLIVQESDKKRPDGKGPQWDVAYLDFFGLESWWGIVMDTL